MSTPLSELLSVCAEQAASVRSPITVRGWIRTSRFSKRVTFLHLFDGAAETLQVVIAPAVEPALRSRLGVGAAVSITGALVPSRGAGQALELKCAPEDVEILGDCDPSTFPVQKKEASPTYWRTIPHLRVRTAQFQRIFRARHTLSQATHRFLEERGFLWVHTPLITHSDCEGAGEAFRVATADRRAALDAEAFFGRAAHLTVSGQLQLEAFACAFSRVYTFGPAFRAEDSHTSRHAAEFWMIEPEIAFADLNDDADLAEDFLKSIFRRLLDERADDMAFFNKFVSKGCVTRLEDFINSDFERLEYTEAISLLERASKSESFEYPVSWGVDLQSEHEKYLTEKHIGRPVIVMNYPKDIKAFYMRLNDDERTVAAMDVLAPGIGEIIGGSQREERLDVFDARLAENDLDAADYDWYRDLRRYGTVPHAGFGLGFERALVYATGVENIRETIPFPRARRQASF